MNTTRRSVLGFPKTIDKAFLDLLDGKTVEEFCPKSKVRGFKVGDTENHCAHFVSHALGFRFGELCLSDRWFGDEGRTMRVDEIFHWCPDRGPWSSRPKDLDTCLIFATISTNVVDVPGAQLEFGNKRQKHVGIWHKGRAYNYHNSTVGKVREGVRTDGEHFFQHVYGPKTKCFYGTFPA
jgi:hypothetical protein